MIKMSTNYPMVSCALTLIESITKRHLIMTIMDKTLDETTIHDPM